MLKNWQINPQMSLITVKKGLSWKNMLLRHFYHPDKGREHGEANDNMEECCHLDVTQLNCTGGIILWWHRQGDHQYAKQPEYQRWTFWLLLPYKVILMNSYWWHGYIPKKLNALN